MTQAGSNLLVAEPVVWVSPNLHFASDLAEDYMAQKSLFRGLQGALPERLSTESEYIAAYI
jgi:hypothetical protein